MFYILTKNKLKDNITSKHASFKTWITGDCHRNPLLLDISNEYCTWSWIQEPWYSHSYKQMFSPGSLNLWGLWIVIYTKLPLIMLLGCSTCCKNYSQGKFVFNNNCCLPLSCERNVDTVGGSNCNEGHPASKKRRCWLDNKQYKKLFSNN